MARDSVRLTTAQALVRYLIAQRVILDEEEVPFVGGIFAIFGHGNVAGVGEALESEGADLPVYRAHNEQAMAHAATAYAKAHDRRRIMACTTSIGPGATNMVTAAALAHVNRLPVLLLPGDTFASRRPDPVLQQVEDFSEPWLSANDAFRPVVRYWDRIVRPEQLLAALPQALSVLLDPADCGPVLLALPQDVQAEAWDFPTEFFEPTVHTIARPRPDRRSVDEAVAIVRSASRPLIIAGGGVHYSGASQSLSLLAERCGIPVAETQAGKSSLSWDHPMNLGSIGVTGSTAANRLAEQADVVLAVGTRLQDFTTASSTLFSADPRFIAINPCRHDSIKYGALPLRGDADEVLSEMFTALGGYRSADSWQELASVQRTEWQQTVDAAIAAPDAGQLPGDAAVLGTVNRLAGSNTVVVCAAGGLPGELHKLWRATERGGYHVEYGYSCMGYEIAGGLGVKLARPDREVIVMVGDGSYLMMNSEIATSLMLGQKLIIVVLDNRGFGCINRLQQSCGSGPFNNLLPETDAPAIDFAAHAASLGADATAVDTLDELESALASARDATRTQVIVIRTDPTGATDEGGAWWDVPVAEVSSTETVREASDRYRAKVGLRRSRDG